MKKVGGLLLAALMIAGCRKSYNCTPVQYSYTYSDNKKIDTLRPGGYFLATQIIPGNNTVFSYRFMGEFCKDRSDDPNAEYLLFESAANSTQFEYLSNNIKDVQCYYHYDMGDGSSTDAVKIMEGVIRNQSVTEYVEY